jgi:general secretion pathway protein A
MGEEYQLRAWWQSPPFKYASLLLLMCALAAGGFYFGRGILPWAPPSQPAQNLASLAVVAEAQKAPAADTLVDWPGVIAQSRSLPQAFNELFKEWQLVFEQELDKPCETAVEFGLQCHWQQGTLKAISRLGYVAVLKFVDDNGISFFGSLMPGSPEQYLVKFNGQDYQLDRQWFDRYWQGSAVILWQAPDGFEQQISASSNPNVIQWLENQLSYHQQRPARVVNNFDAVLLNQLQQFQRQHALEVTETANITTVLLLSRS